MAARGNVDASRRSLARRVAAAFLDAAFDLRSPFPTIDAGAMTAASGAEFLSLPSPAQLEPGNQSLVGLAYLVLIARAVGARSIFEIGTYNGLTALTLARNLQDATVDTIDLPPGARPQYRVGEGDAGNLIAFDTRRYESEPEEARIVQHVGDTASFDFAPFASRFDLVYVDGAHSREYVENDTRAAFSIVSNEGTIVWDDYWREIPDVADVLHELDAPLLRLRSSRLAVWFSDGAAARLAPQLRDAIASR